LALAGWYFFSRGTPEPAEPPPVVNAAPQPAPVLPTAEVGRDTKPKTEPAAEGATLARDFAPVYKTMTEPLSGVTAPATAGAAVPKLQGLTTTLDTIKAGWDKLPEAGRAAIIKVSSDSLSKLKELVAKVLAIPGVGEKLKPILDTLVTKLAALT